MRNLLLTMLVISAASTAEAATFVLSNATGDPVDCQVTLSGGAPFAVNLAVGESRAINCGRTIVVSYAAGNGPQNLSLQPYMAYLFVTKPKKGLELMTADLLGKSPGDKDVPLEVPAIKRVKIPVKVLVDDSDRRTKTVWAATLRKRFDEANAIMKAQAGVVFDIVDTTQWTVGEDVTDLRSCMVDFERQVKPEPAEIAIGFVSRGFPPQGRQAVPFSTSRGMSAPYILIRETEPKNEPERVEVLVQQLGRYLGAITSPDPISAMRLTLGDGKAVHAKFRIGFDPLNLLAINIVAEELRKGPLLKLADWPVEQQVRLARIYATLGAAVPDDPLNDELQGLLARAGLKPAQPEVMPEKAAKAPPEAPPAKARKTNPEHDAIRKVVRAIVVKAEDNARLPAASRVKGDDLTELYVRTAADMAFTLEPDLRKKAFLVGIGIGLDDSDALRNKPVFGDLWKGVESDDERKIRLAVLGNPTMRYRRDLCQHFVISAALTAIAGDAIAEQIGLAKELVDRDRPNGSGFSFCDLAADFSGVALANTVLASGESLNGLRTKFAVKSALPKIDDLPEGLTAAKFKDRFGDLGDDRFKAMIAELRKRVKELK